MRPQDAEPHEKPSKPSGTEEARRIVEEYADEKSLKSFASSLADPT
jgi:hypothetical protein